MHPGWKGEREDEERKALERKGFGFWDGYVERGWRKMAALATNSAMEGKVKQERWKHRLIGLKLSSHSKKVKFVQKGLSQWSGEDDKKGRSQATGHRAIGMRLDLSALCMSNAGSAPLHPPEHFLFA